MRKYHSRNPVIIPLLILLFMGLARLSAQLKDPSTADPTMIVSPVSATPIPVKSLNQTPFMVMAKATPAHPPSLEQAALLLEEGRTTLEEGPLNAAKQVYEACANTMNAYICDYQLAKVYYYLSFMNDIHKLRKDGEKALEKALYWEKITVKLNDQSADAHSLLADIWGKKIVSYGDMFTAMDCGPKMQDENKKALKLDPNNPRVQASLGRQYLEAPGMFGGDVKKAIACFQKALELDPKSDETYVWLAKAYRKQKDRVDFENTLQKALSLNPKNVMAQLELKDWKKGSAIRP